MRVDFSLGRLRNEDSSATLENLIELYSLINNNINNRVNNTLINSSDLEVDISSEININLVEVNPTLPNHKRLNLNFTDNLEKNKYYLIIDSNGSKCSINSSNLEISKLNNNSTFNRTLIELYKLEGENKIIILDIKKDMYFIEEGDFDTEDFLGWDFNIG